MTIPTGVTKANKEIQTVHKLQWDQTDLPQYIESVQTEISKLQLTQNQSNSIQNITKALLTASNKAVPTKPIKLKGPKWKASPRVQKHLKNCKQLYSKWKSEGKQADHPFRKQLKAEKKNLRSQQRKEHAEDRLNLYQQIMDNPSTDLFYKLINRNRSKPRTNSTGIDIEGELEFNPAIQRKAFAKYYEDLSIPKESKFDNSYLELCQIRQHLVEEVLYNQQTTIEPYKEDDVSKAIDNLNSGKSPDDFFFQTALLLAKYNLPDIFDKNIPIPSKLSWKKLVKTEISSFWTLRLKEEAHQMSSLKFLNLNFGNADSTHPVWDSVEQNLIEIRKASTKVRMLTGTYMVQADKHKFSQYTIDPTCLLCHREIEDILHVLTQCPVLCNERKEYFTPIKQLVTENSPPGTWELLFNNKLAVTQLVLDCTKYMKQLGFKEELILKLETLTRHFCFKLHYKRISLLKKLDG
ncbi:unnamed protein product [Mytilus edulis]|uniref:Reverse transcriptase zinc-binding domain-containing protein n=1 Tax=Mytilus edulis TaxID=6550 RepID=A0A8S3T9P3_MYTED|nr:unnamed protein product [Mytilus edulis]